MRFEMTVSRFRVVATTPQCPVGFPTLTCLCFLFLALFLEEFAWDFSAISAVSGSAVSPRIGLIVQIYHLLLFIFLYVQSMHTQF